MGEGGGGGGGEVGREGGGRSREGGGGEVGREGGRTRVTARTHVHVQHT